MEINSEKSRILVNITEQKSPTNMKINGKVLDEINQIKHFGSSFHTNNRWDISYEVKSRLAQARLSMTVGKYMASVSL